RSTKKSAQRQDFLRISTGLSPTGRRLPYGNIGVIPPIAGCGAGSLPGLGPKLLPPRRAVANRVPVPAAGGSGARFLGAARDNCIDGTIPPSVHRRARACPAGTTAVSEIRHRDPVHPPWPR